MLTDAQVVAAAAALYQAERDRAPIAPISQTYADADIDDAYRISTAVTDLKVKAGRAVKGYKIGLTSPTMQSLLGATGPNYGTLFDDWFVEEGSTVSRSRWNRPLVEVEVAFVLRETLAGPGVNAADVIRATDFVLPAFEIVDTRQKGRGPKPLVDTIADAGACGSIVLGGRPARLTDIDLRQLGATLSINGDVADRGVASAVMGNPINSVAWLANKLHDDGVALAPGNVVMSGSFVKATPFQSGDAVVARFDTLGELSFSAAD
jgi:2-keto-4-pentenoate hydratase